MPCSHGGGGDGERGREGAGTYTGVDSLVTEWDCMDGPTPKTHRNPGDSAYQWL